MDKRKNKKTMPVKIVATGRYLPKKVVTNEDFIKEFKSEMSPEELKKRIGTQEHRVASPDEQPSDLLTKAAKNTLKKAGVKPKELTRIIVSTTPP